MCYYLLVCQLSKLWEVITDLILKVWPQYSYNCSLIFLEQIFKMSYLYSEIINLYSIKTPKFLYMGSCTYLFFIINKKKHLSSVLYYQSSWDKKEAWTTLRYISLSSSPLRNVSFVRVRQPHKCQCICSQSQLTSYYFTQLLKVLHTM